jgi:surface antigen
MRPHVFAVALTAALLMPGGAALADPPWERGHEYEYEARGCKYEYKAGPHGSKEEYKCDAGPRYAGGPPPWAPAHGWRRKHTRHYEHEARYAIPELGIEFGRCNRDVIGGVIGGAAGGVIGSQFGKGSGKTAATIGGTIAGVLIGGAIGRSMDEADQACLAQTLEQAPPQHVVAWSNPDGGHYRVVPLEGYEDRQGRICRDYRTTATIEGRQQQLYGTACRQPDGSWQRVS